MEKQKHTGSKVDGLAALAEVVHVGALGVWLGSLVMVAVTAAIAFPTMRDLDPTLPGYSLYPDGHWEIAAGQVMAQAFRVSDGVQVVCASVCGITIALLIGTRRLAIRRVSTIFRLIIMVVLLGALTEYLLRVAEPMQSLMGSFWELAQAGDVAAADAVRQKFDVLHPKSSARLGALMVGLLLAIGATAASWCATMKEMRKGAQL